MFLTVLGLADAIINGNHGSIVAHYDTAVISAAEQRCLPGSLPVRVDTSEDADGGPNRNCEEACVDEEVKDHDHWWCFLLSALYSLPQDKGVDFKDSEYADGPAFLLRAHQKIDYAPVA